MCLQPVVGAFSDIVGRRPVLLTFGVLGTLLTVPILTALQNATDPWTAFFLIMGALVIVSGYTAINAVVKAELFPTSVRAMGVGFPYAITVALFGGTAEYVALYLKEHRLRARLLLVCHGMHFRLAGRLRADARYALAVGHAPPRLTLSCRLCCASVLFTFGTYDRKDAAGFFEADTYGEVERHSGGASRQSRRYTHFSGCHFSGSYRHHFFRRGTAPVPEPCRLRDRHVAGDGGRVPVDPHPRAWPRAYRAAVRLYADEIRIGGFYGLAILAGSPARRIDSILILLAGPLANAINSILLLLALGMPTLTDLLYLGTPMFASPVTDVPVLRVSLQWLAYVNVGIVIFNLLPAFPLDGGRIARLLLGNVLADAVAVRLVAGAGRGQRLLERLDRATQIARRPLQGSFSRQRARKSPARIE